MNNNYGINDIESLSFKDGVRKRIQMYLGSNDMQGVYNGIQEIISNSIDEYYMGYGKEIHIGLNEKNNMITITDHGRGVPFGIKKDGSNVLVDIFSKAHTGGKFNDKAYNSVAGLNGIGAKATCLSSEFFNVSVIRDGKHATAKFEKGILTEYKEEDWHTNETGTSIQFSPDKEVFSLEEININFDKLCDQCRNLSYLTKGLSFILENDTERKVFCAEEGLVDLIKDKCAEPIHNTPLYYSMQEGENSVEVALQWTKGKEQWYVFTNGIPQIEGGTSLTGMKTAITRFMKKHLGENFGGDTGRTGLIYAVACKTPHPSFANQIKSKINNPELNGLAQKATGFALNNFAQNNKEEFKIVSEIMIRQKKAELAAERARQQVLDAAKDIEKNQKRKVFASDKLKDAEFLGQDSILLVVEGNSAGASMAVARDVKKYGILSLRGKLINALSNPDEKVYANEEIKLLLSAMNINPNRYDSKKLRYGKIGICTDADSDGYHIGLLIMATLHYICPEFIEEGRLCWLRSPLYIVKSGKEEKYYFTDEEFNIAKNSGKIKGEVTRAKGLGALSADQAHNSMFIDDIQKLDPLIPTPEALFLLEELMGEDVEPRRNFIFNEIDFNEIRE